MDKIHIDKPDLQCHEFREIYVEGVQCCLRMQKQNGSIKDRTVEHNMAVGKEGAHSPYNASSKRVCDFERPRPIGFPYRLLTRPSPFSHAINK